MARSRNIKPAFFDNDALAEIEPLGRLLFIGLWTIADYKGDMEWREKRIKAQILPYDNCDIKNIMINLDKSGFVRFYSDGEQIYLNIVNFSKHQNPHKNERVKGSEIPKMTNDMRQAVDLIDITINRDLSGLRLNNSHSNRADSLLMIPDSLNLIPETLNPIVIGKIPIQQQQQILDLFNDKFHMLPRVEILTEKRKALIAKFMNSRQVEKSGYALDELGGYFDYIITNCTWMLRDGLSGEGKQYKPKDFNYFMNDDCYAAVKEQRYNDGGI